MAPRPLKKAKAIILQFTLTLADQGGMDIEVGDNLGYSLSALTGGETGATLALQSLLYRLHFLLMINFLVSMIRN